MQILRNLLLSIATVVLVAITSAAAVPPDLYDPQQAFAETDLNQDGRIDIGEFRARLIEVFFSADTNKDGYLEASELGQLPFAESLEEADGTNDGKISLPEFVRVRIILFFEVDTNRDGELELNEVIDAYQGRSTK